METKFCKKCGGNKFISEFHKHIRHKDGLSSMCKECHNFRHRERVKGKHKELYAKRREYMIEYNRQYRLNNPDYFKEYRQKNKDKVRVYIEKNKKHIRKLANKRICDRYKNDPAFNAICRARNRIIKFFKDKPKMSNTLGCSFEIFKTHIEKQFIDGMCWDNRGEWHIDHYFPLSVAYDLGEVVFKKATHYTNLRPVWAAINQKKNDKVPAEFLNSDGSINIDKFLNS